MVSRTLSVHKEHEFLLKLETAGLTESFAQKVVDSKGNELAAKVVKFIQNDGFEPTTSQKCAHEIMGRNFFGVEKAIHYFGVNPTRQQILVLSEIPFSEAVLQEAKDTHVLVAVFPLSIFEIRGKMDFKLFNNHAWHCKDSFYIKERGEASWQLVRKTPVDNSTSKNWEEQQALIGEDDEVPTAQVMVYAIIGYYLVTGQYLFGHIWVRTSCVDSDGDRVGIGHFVWYGLGVNYERNDARYDYLGVSSARKF